MNERDPFADEAIVRVLSGNASAEEHARLGEWMRMSEAHQRQFNGAAGIWHLTEGLRSRVFERVPVPARVRHLLRLR